MITCGGGGQLKKVKYCKQKPSWTEHGLTKELAASLVKA